MTRRIRGRGQGPAKALVWGALLVASGLGTVGGILAAPYLSVPPPASPSAALGGASLAVAASTPPDAPATTLLPTLDGPLTVLFMATDVNYTVKDGKRVAGLRGNTDTMMLARFDPARGDARVLSIPRDTRTKIPGHGTFKINAAVPYGGSALAVRTVSGLLGVPVERFVLINTRAVVQLVEALGGVEVFVPVDLK
jgi:anionic cell wall polymer biosynthesis LytR-Cps2A-Psr (LCP) family protein